MHSESKVFTTVLLSRYSVLRTRPVDGGEVAGQMALVASSQRASGGPLGVSFTPPLWLGRGRED